MFREAVLGFMGVERPKGNSIDSQRRKKGQPVGEQCKGVDVEECKSYFGEGVLPRVCGTCPN